MGGSGPPLGCASDALAAAASINPLRGWVLGPGDANWNSLSPLASLAPQNERIGRMLQMHANDRTEIKQARAGDIVALIGLKDTTTGETLCDKSNSVILEKME